LVPLSATAKKKKCAGKKNLRTRKRKSTNELSKRLTKRESILKKDEKKEGTAKSQKYPLNCINQIIIVTMIKEDSKSKMNILSMLKRRAPRQKQATFYSNINLPR